MEDFDINYKNTCFGSVQEEIDFKGKLFMGIISQNFYLTKNFRLINR